MKAQMIAGANAHHYGTTAAQRLALSRKLVEFWGIQYTRTQVELRNGPPPDAQEWASKWEEEKKQYASDCLRILHIEDQRRMNAHRDIIRGIDYRP